MKAALWFLIAIGTAVVLRVYWRANATPPDHQRDRNPMVRPRTDPIDQEAE